MWRFKNSKLEKSVSGKKAEDWIRTESEKGTRGLKSISCSANNTIILNMMDFT